MPGNGARKRRELFKARWLLGEFVETHQLILVFSHLPMLRGSHTLAHIFPKRAELDTMFAPRNEWEAACGVWAPANPQRLPHWPEHGNLNAGAVRFRVCKRCIGIMMGPRKNDGKDT